MYNIWNVRYTRENVDELKQKHHTFVCICYVFIFPNKHKVIWEVFLSSHYLNQMSNTTGGNEG